MRTVFAFTCTAILLVLLGRISQSQTRDAAAQVNVRNIAMTEEGSFNVAVTSGAPGQTGSSGVILAEQQPGSDLGSKIMSANTALGSAHGEIRVTKPGEISARIVLSPNHDLVCAGGITLTLANPQSSIVQESNTQVRGCTFTSTQVHGSASIFSQGASNVGVEYLTFIGGGYHIEYTSVSNFSIKNTRHVSITTIGASPISINMSSHGRIDSPRIEPYTVPAGTGVRLIGIRKSSFIDVINPVIRAVDASTVPGCGGVSFTATTNSTLQGGEIHGLKNCDGVLTESIDKDASSDIQITGTASTGHNGAQGAGHYAGNGEGFDIFNSRRVRLSNVTADDNGTFASTRQPGIEVSNSTEITISNSTSNNNGANGIKIDGSPKVILEQCHTNHNGEAGIVVMPAIGNVTAAHASPSVKWAPGGPNVTFSAVWPPGTKVAVGSGVYSAAEFHSTGELTLTTNFPGATGTYPYNVDSYVEITGGESLDNGQRHAGLPAEQHGGEREGIYFAGGSTGEINGHISRLHAADTQSRKTQTYGIRLENQAHIVATGISVAGNLAGGVRDSPRRSSIQGEGTNR